MRDYCQVCGEEKPDDELKEKVLGLYRRTVCRDCDEKHSKIKQRNLARKLEARRCGFCGETFDSPLEKNRHQKNECDDMPRTRIEKPDE